MISFFANIFGYLLNALYILVKNYGLAIILFSIIVKIVLLPVSISQQKSMKKTAKIQEKMKALKVKYKNDQEALNRETMALYKNEKVNPFSGCLSGIVQIVLLFAIFYLVRSPLTYMKKVDPSVIENYTNEIQQEQEGSKKSAYPEIQIIEQKGQTNEEVNINMDFLGINLSKVPTADLNDWKVYIIPVLYVISSFISMRITTQMQKSMKAKKEEVIEVTEEGKKTEEVDPMESANKSMTMLMPIMSISIAIIAPLGLALYWLVNNILMILERMILNKYLGEPKEE